MARNKIIVLLEGHENIASEGIKLLEKKKYELLFSNNVEEILSDDELRTSKAILVRGALIDQILIESMPNLKVIARSGVGTDNIDIKVATRQKVFVCNVPEANFISVAEHVIGMLVSLSHQIVNGDKAIRKEQFNNRHRYVGSELKGKTIGIIGFGRIGQLVAKKCVHGLDMNVLAYDPYVKKVDQEGVRLLNSLDYILENSDFITLHLPYTQSLHHFINQEAFNKMKKTSYIINCARGGLIDEVALVEAIEQGEIAGAGLDVFQSEPPAADHIIWNAKNVILTPHIGASTHESLTRMAVGAAKEIIRVLDGEQPINAINKFE
ncbi:hydroxyacid dehydrogenase [Virgibacillus kimchii]